MELFNIGPLELIIFLVIAFLVLGPKGMIQTAYKVGKWLRGFVRSPMWREILNYSQEIRDLPKKIMDETGLEAELNSVKQTTNKAMKEVKTTLKDVAQAARVPEAEHIRLETGPQASKASPVKPLASLTPPAPAAKGVAVQEIGQPVLAAEIVPAAQELSAPTDSLQAEQPVPTAEIVPAMQEVSATQVVSAEVESQPSDQPLLDQTPVTDLPAEQSAAPAPRKRAARKRSPEPVEASLDQGESLETAPAAVVPVEEQPVEQLPAPRKRAARKPAKQPANSADPAVLDVAASGSNGLSLQPTVGFAPVAETTEHPEPPTAFVSATQEVAITPDEPAMLQPEVEPAVKLKPAARKRAPRVADTALLVDNAPGPNGHEPSTVGEEPAAQPKPARRPRKPRVVEE